MCVNAVCVYFWVCACVCVREREREREREWIDSHHAFYFLSIVMKGDGKECCRLSETCINYFQKCNYFVRDT